SCPECRGYGEVITPDLDKLVDLNQSLRDYAIKFKPLSPSGWQGRWMMTGGLFDPDQAIKDYSAEKRQLLLYGPGEGKSVNMPFHTKNGPQDHDWEGLLPRFTRLYINRDISKLKEVSIDDVLAVSKRSDCSTCQGSGLNPKVLASKINGLNIADYDQLELKELLEELKRITDSIGASIAGQAILYLNQLIE